MHRQARRTTKVLSVLATVLVLSAVVAAPAGASGPPNNKSYTKSFAVSTQRYFSTIHRCVRVTLSGKISFTVKYDNAWSAFYRSRKVLHPALNVSTYKSCVQGPGIPLAPVYKMSMTQRWSSQSCSAGVSIGVSAPWGVSVSATPGCKKARVAKRSTTYVGRAGSRTQYNSTTVASFGNEYLYPTAWGHSYGGPGEVKVPLCFKASSSVVIYPTRTSGSDSWQPTLKPCVRWW